MLETLVQNDFLQTSAALGVLLARNFSIYADEFGHLVNQIRSKLVQNFQISSSEPWTDDALISVIHSQALYDKEKKINLSRISKASLNLEWSSPAFNNHAPCKNSRPDLASE